MCVCVCGCLRQVLFLAGNDPVNFANLHLAFLALWRSATGDDWTDMM